MTIKTDSQPIEKLNIRDTTFNEFYNRLKEYDARRIDYVVPSDKIEMVDNVLRLKNVITQNNQDLQELGIESTPDAIDIKPSDNMITQICDKLSIPIRYAKNKMIPKKPELWDANVNGWLDFEREKAKSRKFFLRTWTNDDGGVLGRSFLSDSYLPLTNFTLMGWIGKAIAEQSAKTGVKIAVESCSLTDTKMYARFIIPSIANKIKGLRGYKNPKTFTESDGDVVAGFTVSNSEIGAGSIVVAPILFVDACANGMVWTKEAWKKTHLGAKLEEGLVTWSQETQAMNFKLINSQIQDVMRRFMQPDFMGAKVEEIQKAIETKLEHPIQCVSNLCNEVGISDTDTMDVLNYFAQQGTNSSAFDAVQAITFYARENVNEDRRFELECKAVDVMSKVKDFDVLEMA